MTRRTTTGGSIRHRTDLGRWEGRYTAADGRRRSVYGTTRADVQRALRTALSDADNAIRPTRGRETVGAYLATWLDEIDGIVRPATLTSYRATVTRYIDPAIGRLPLRKLEPDDVHRMLRAMTVRGDLSPTTVRYTHAVLRTALSRAVELHRVVRNVAKLTPAPKRVRYAIPPVSAKDVAAFREAIAGHRWESVYLVALGTGLRQGEILGLTWQDVDLEAGTLTVRHSLQAGELVETKTDHSRRTLRLPLPVSTELRRQRQRQSESREAARRWDVRGFVFTTANGGPLDGVNVTHELRRLLVRAGLRPMRFHDLRHAFATLQIEAGAGLFEISRALGHKDITTTADVYAHLTDAMAQQTADRMTAILGTG